MLRREFLAVSAALLVAGCGYRPLYGDGGSNSVMTELRGIAIPEPETRVGQLIRNELLSTIRPAGTATEDRYRLVLRPEVRKESIIARTDPGTTRSAIRLTVAYDLVDLASAERAHSGKVFSQVSYDVVREPVADLQAEANATERAAREAGMDIRSRLAAFFASR
jgi:LPS-assembly lipoprotein